MKQRESFSNSLCTDELRLAERELSAFIAAVAELFGADQARMSAEDWLDESELMDVSPQSTRRDWRAITIAASARLANRLNAWTASDGETLQNMLAASTDTEVSPIPSLNCFASQ